jgi:sarcosine oxidase, subunit delta
MMHIPCPWCGPRDESEFQCGGISHLTRPGLECSDAEWSDYLYVRDNPKGALRERWRHAYGCGQWFNLMRHTATHEILAAYRMDEPGP